MVLCYTVEPMTSGDIAEVLQIERESFPFPWSERSFLSELALPYSAYWVVRLAAEEGAPGVMDSPPPPRHRWWSVGRRRAGLAGTRAPIVAYAGLQVILDEGHIMTLAVRPSYRRQGLGEMLLQRCFDEARRRGALRLTLEVRVTNLPAQALYCKYGFEAQGRRLRYYANGEDALIMWSDRLDMAEVQSRLEDLRVQLLQRMAAQE